MKEFVFATNNAHKLSEIRQITSADIHIISLNDIGFHEEIPETSDTISGNALQKAWYFHDRYNKNCFADDTGLEVDFLDGAPGVYSARYAGEACSFSDNVEKLLKEMGQTENRKARFVTVIALLFEGKPYLFEGVINGSITTSPKGEGGFGYDPVFLPDGYQQTFAEMQASVKNSISHRGLATKKLVEFLKTVI